MIRSALLVALFLPAVAFAEVSSSELLQAEANLRAKQVARAAAATQPAQITRGELEAIQAELAALKRENLLLLAENTRLKQELPVVATTRPVEKVEKVRPVNTIRPVKSVRPAVNTRFHVGMTLAEAQDLLGSAGKVIQKTDKATVYHWIVGQREILATFTDDKLTAFVTDLYVAPPVHSAPTWMRIEDAIPNGNATSPTIMVP